MSHDEVLGNAMLFFLAGYDTTATTLTYLMYSLALNPDCQQKAAEEVDRVLGQQVCVCWYLHIVAEYFFVVLFQTVLFVYDCSCV